MLLDLLLDDNAKIKISMLQHMKTLEAGAYPVHYFELEFGYSYVKTANLIHTMAEEFREWRIALLNDRGKVVVSDQLPQVERYQQWLFHNSIPYKFLLQTLVSPEMTMNEFCEQEFLSPSSITRRLKPMTLYLKQHGIRLNCLKMEVTGSEAAIRLAYFNFLWQASYGEDLLDYFNRHQEPLAELFDEKDEKWLSCMEEREWLIFMGISILRSKLGRHLETTVFNGLSLPKLNQKFCDYLRATGVPDTYVQRENNYLGYLIFYWPQFFDSNDPRISYLKEFKGQRGHEAVKHASQFYNYCEKHILHHRFPEKAAPLVQLNVLSIFLKFSLFKGCFPKNADFTRSMVIRSHPLIQTIQEAIQAYFDQSEHIPSWLQNDAAMKDMNYLLAFIVYPFYEKQVVQEELKVGVIGFPNHFLLHMVLTYLRDIPFVKFQMTSSKRIEAFDLYLSSSESLVPENTPAEKIYIAEGLDQQHFDDLYHTLEQCYKKKRDIQRSMRRD